MYLDIAYPKHTVQLELGIKKIGTGVGIRQSRIYNFHLLAGCRFQFFERKYFMFPYIV